MSFFPDKVQRDLAWLPFEHIAYTPLQIYLGKLDRHSALRALGIQWLWVIVCSSWRTLVGTTPQKKSQSTEANVKTI